MQRVKLSCLCHTAARLPTSSLCLPLVRHFRVLAVSPRTPFPLALNSFVRRFAESSDGDKKRRARDFFKKKKGTTTPKTFYDVLGVDPKAKHEEIRLRYLELAKTHHPDSGGTQQEFAKISSAWKVLGNKEERMKYDTKLEYNPEEAGDTADYNGQEVDFTLRVIMSHGYLKVGSYPMSMPRAVLVPLVWMGVEQIEGDTPVHRRLYPFSFMWTLFLLLFFRQVYVTYRDWRMPPDDDRPFTKLSQEARSRFAWRVIGLSIALSTLPLCYRRWDFLSKAVKEAEGGERLADMVGRIAPTVIFWTAGWTFALPPIVGSSAEFIYSQSKGKEVQWNSPKWDVLELNGPRMLSGLSAAAAAALCVQRAREKGVPFKFCGKAATIGFVVGRTFGWLMSFALVGRKRRAELRSPAATPTIVEPEAKPPVVDQLSQLQREVEQLRQALQQQTQAPKVDSS